MLDHYILDDEGHPVPVEDLLTWARWFHAATRDGRRMVAQEQRVYQGVEILVSTVFLGRNHQYGAGPPLLWETMIFGGALDKEMERYPTCTEAEAGHDKWVFLVFGESASTQESLEEFSARVDQLLAELPTDQPPGHQSTST